MRACIFPVFEMRVRCFLFTSFGHCGVWAFRDSGRIYKKRNNTCVRVHILLISCTVGQALERRPEVRTNNTHHPITSTT